MVVDTNAPCLHAKVSFSTPSLCKSYNHPNEQSLMNSPSSLQQSHTIPLTLSWHPGIATCTDEKKHKQPDVTIRNAWLHWQPSRWHYASWLTSLKKLIIQRALFPQIWVIITAWSQTDSVSIIFKPNLQIFISTLKKISVNKCDEKTIKKMMNHLPRRWDWRWTSCTSSSRGSLWPCCTSWILKGTQRINPGKRLRICCLWVSCTCCWSCLRHWLQLPLQSAPAVCFCAAPWSRRMRQQWSRGHRMGGQK